MSHPPLEARIRALQASAWRVRVGAVAITARHTPIRMASLAALACLLPLLAAAAESSLPSPDHIVVLKAERKLLLMAGDTIVKAMTISLGLMPEGPKRREGDFRTPGGSYFLESKKSDSDFFLSLKISYPNNQDRSLASTLGVDPGGQIMIHGLPNEPKYAEAMYDGWDWTDGCIAVSNSDMIDLWRLTSVSMPIEIRP
jgi:murein L,D-transpeptidase YafK